MHLRSRCSNVQSRQRSIGHWTSGNPPTHANKLPPASWRTHPRETRRAGRDCDEGARTHARGTDEGRASRRTTVHDSHARAMSRAPPLARSAITACSHRSLP
eukprot:353500-Chlamydomonas_euryale.AAC.13